MNVPEDLAAKIAEKTNEQLAGMLNKPEDWQPEALDFARAELQRRGASHLAADALPEATTTNPTRPTVPSRQSGLADIRANIWAYFWGDRKGNVFGLLSMAASACAVLFCVVTPQLLHYVHLRFLSFHHFTQLLWLWILPAILLIGIISPVIAWKRRERYWALSGISLLINMALLLWLVFIISIAGSNC